MKMRVGIRHVALLWLAVTGARTTKWAKRDVNFASVRTDQTHDYSNRRGRFGDKYFHEAIVRVGTSLCAVERDAGAPPARFANQRQFHPHYDGRFASRPLAEAERRSNLTALIQTFQLTMRDIGAETWIMHGSLLGWWWNGAVLPWDSDLDVQVSEASLHHLAAYYNMSTHHYRFPGGGHAAGRDYLLEVNPHYANASTADRHNVIDARWLDTRTGLFIDITTLRPNRTGERLGKAGLMMCKDGHWYWRQEVFPLRDTVFEHVAVKVPFAYSQLLQDEYGPAALSAVRYAGHVFDTATKQWVRRTGTH